MKTKYALGAKVILAIPPILMFLLPRWLFAYCGAILASKQGQLLYGSSITTGKVVIHNPSVCNEKELMTVWIQLVNQHAFNTVKGRFC